MQSSDRISSSSKKSNPVWKLISPCSNEAIGGGKQK